ncbi:Signal transduction histidine kinase [Halolactibacillus halophilus]|uniref:histidine kinase n=1 Tax=Halolactibacillus halophilus TaxID=306540 RepID=A0A1I5LZM2_9BACI|nr:HAMP domain-containing sensor histidine kinase [Halolactibacillus halophilus]GEM00956.1 two-component sensor histidine kinase [Halolactibacillus halophilus]SFP02607.1 Signal transduction histidine kinase [Halolactibacillus halophilus]
MLKNNQVKPSLNQVFITRYLLALIVGLLVIMFVSVAWIRETTKDNRLDLMVVMAESTASRIVESRDDTEEPFNSPASFEQLKPRPVTVITDLTGSVVQIDPPFVTVDPSLSEEELESEEAVFKKVIAGTTYYLVTQPIERDDVRYGYVVLMSERSDLIAVEQEYVQLFFMLVSFGFVGFITILVMTKRLTKPITAVSQAAKQIEAGDYQIHLPEGAREREIDELMRGFNQMAHKLDQLESLRTELLAGVTHELKTPVTSISGLLQAIDSGVVKDAEAKTFIKLSLNETAKLNQMVKDLLHFNQFSLDAVKVSLQELELDRLLAVVIERFNLIPEVTSKGKLKLNVALPIKVKTDPVRFEQIMTNLLQNANQASGDNQMISVTVTDSATTYIIDVSDYGQGIEKQDIPYIFERFYRGENKKYATRGLGLGLSLSKMMAQALEGDLVLVQTSESGTTFRLTLPKKSE